MQFLSKLIMFSWILSPMSMNIFLFITTLFMSSAGANSLSFAPVLQIADFFQEEKLNTKFTSQPEYSANLLGDRHLICISGTHDLPNGREGYFRMATDLIDITHDEHDFHIGINENQQAVIVNPSSLKEFYFPSTAAKRKIHLDLHDSSRILHLDRKVTGLEQSYKLLAFDIEIHSLYSPKKFVYFLLRDDGEILPLGFGRKNLSSLKVSGSEINFGGLKADLKSFSLIDQDIKIVWSEIISATKNLMNKNVFAHIPSKNSQMINMIQRQQRADPEFIEKQERFVYSRGKPISIMDYKLQVFQLESGTTRITDLNAKFFRTNFSLLNKLYYSAKLNPNMIGVPQLLVHPLIKNDLVSITESPYFSKSRIMGMPIFSIHHDAEIGSNDFFDDYNYLKELNQHTAFFLFVDNKTETARIYFFDVGRHQYLDMAIEGLNPCEYFLSRQSELLLN